MLVVFTLPALLFFFFTSNGSLIQHIKQKVTMDICSNERMTMQNLQIPDTAESIIVPKWLFPPRFSNKDRLTSSRPDLVLVTPISAKTRKQQIMEEGGSFGVAGGN